MMTHRIFATWGALAVAGTITLAAQTPTTPPRPTTPSPGQTAQPRDDKTITVSGCLKPWTGTAGTATTPAAPGSPGAAGSAGAMASPAKFLLTGVRDDASRSGAATTTAKPESPETPAPTTMGTMGGGSKQYTLTADANVNLSAHLNHQVRVTGTVSNAPMAGSTTGSTTGATGTARPGETPRTGESVHSTMDGGTIAVTSVTMVSATCTATSF